MEHALSSSSDLRREIRELQDRLSLRERHLEALEPSEDQILEWRSKYERLFEAHRKLQRTNSNLEDKLLRVVDKFESDKSQMTRDLASQTQKLVEAKLNLQQLRDQNADLSADLHLSINLLQNRPSSYVAQRVDNLPSEVRARLKRNRNGWRETEGKKITVSVDQGEDDTVSAAILAKVLEERDKERRKSAKFCIDVGTQTHGWCFPDNKIYSNKSPSALGEKDTNNNNSGNTSEDLRVLRSSLSFEGGDRMIEDIRPRRIIDLTPRQSSSSHILLAASVIQRPPSSSTKSPSYSSTSENSSVAPDEEFIESKLNSIRFGTYSVTETDL